MKRTRLSLAALLLVACQSSTKVEHVTAAGEGGDTATGGAAPTGGRGAPGGAPTTGGARATGGGGGAGAAAAGGGGVQGGAGGAEAGTLEVATTSLPAVHYRVAFAEQLAVVGGGTGLTWSVVAGSLPPGVALSSSGALAGTPTAEGLFTFSVRVVDASGASGTVELTVEVLRKRWLTFLTNDDAATLGQLLYAVDVSSTLMPKTLVSAGLPTTGSVTTDGARFAPTGARFAFLADKAVDERLELFVVSSGSTLGAAAKVDVAERLGTIDQLAWSPSGDRLVFGTSDDAGTTYSLYWVDFGAAVPTPRLVATSASPYGSVVWVGEQRLVARRWVEDATYGVYVATLTGDTFSAFTAVTGLPATGMQRITPARGRERVLLQDDTQPPVVVDFEREQTYAAPVRACFSPDLDYALLFPADDTAALFPLAALATPDAEPLVVVPGGGPGGPAPTCSWSADGRTVAWQDAAYDLRAVRIEGTAALAGTQVGGYAGSLVPVVSPDGQWVAYAHEGDLYLAPMDPAGLGEGVQVNPPLVEADAWVYDVAFAPNSAALAYRAPQVSAGIADLFVAALGPAGADTPRQVNDPVTTGEGVRDLVWSVDSRHLAYTQAHKAWPTGINVAVADATVATPVPRLLTTNDCFSDPCPTASRLAFTP